MWHARTSVQDLDVDLELDLDLDLELDLDLDITGLHCLLLSHCHVPGCQLCV